ncbi:hypothetical protein FHS27_003494 [Rhodopirellula rubra]|uniref:Uncharacterized protein n=1 Tax=Aporhodopirellula rubra TaxID=980271 RepID=A0A7W5H6N7_9BACT|nr:hypothetical protein [Aporhodopirellula rubra]
MAVVIDSMIDSLHLPARRNPAIRDWSSLVNRVEITCDGLVSRGPLDRDAMFAKTKMIACWIHVLMLNIQRHSIEVLPQ